MSTSRTKQLKQARKQLGNVVDQLDLDKRALVVADKAGLAKRRKLLGFIPVSRKRPEWGRIAGYGAAVAAGMVGSRVLRNGKPAEGEHEDSGAEHRDTGGAAEGLAIAEAVAKAAERGAEKGAQRGVQKAVADSAEASADTGD